MLIRVRLTGIVMLGLRNMKMLSSYSSKLRFFRERTLSSMLSPRETSDSWATSRRGKEEISMVLPRYSEASKFRYHVRFSLHVL